MGAHQGKTCDVMILDDAPNVTVAKLPWRQFPGVVVQGDSLKILHDELTEVRDALRKSEEATEILDDLIVRIGTLVSRYETALDAAGLQLPYPRRGDS
jgi:hypothetical protein